MKKYKYIGELPDIRPASLKIKDYDSRELDFGGFKWLTKKQAEKNAKEYIVRNQYKKSSCVGSSMCNALWNTEKEVLADEYLYTQRKNKPSEGSNRIEMCELIVSQGVCGRDSMREVKTEAEANAVKISQEQRLAAKEHQQESYVFFNDPDIDEIVKYLNEGFAVSFSIFAEYNEWKLSEPVIKDTKLTPAKAEINHSVCGIPNTGYMYKGQKYFILTDSAHFGGAYLRHLTEGFVKDRVKHGNIFIDLKTEEVSKTPPFKYVWTRNLTVGDTGEDVQMLQKALQWLGYFPHGTSQTFFFGGITRQAVKDFQEANRSWILKPLGLDTPTGIFGKQTMKILNNLLK
jgi:hypothetical protein